jgi:hypothetical protein
MRKAAAAVHSAVPDAIQLAPVPNRVTLSCYSDLTMIRKLLSC